MSVQAKTIRVLIVDDEPLARRTIRDLLAEQPDIEIIGECSGGFEAIAFMQEALPDLLFLDVQMPGLDGFETLARKPDPAIAPARSRVEGFDACP